MLMAASIMLAAMNVTAIAVLIDFMFWFGSKTRP
jgi:hypothetical protein